MPKHFFTKEEYNCITDNLKDSSNLIMTKYKNGYSLKEEGRDELYFFIYPEKGTDTNGKKKFLQAFRTPLIAIMTVVPFNNILNGAFDWKAKNDKSKLTGEDISVAKEVSSVMLNTFFVVTLVGGALFLSKLWDKSKPADLRYGLNVKEINESKINDIINLDQLNKKYPIALEMELNKLNEIPRELNKSSKSFLLQISNISEKDIESHAPSDAKNDLRSASIQSSKSFHKVSYVSETSKNLSAESVKSSKLFNKVSYLSEESVHM